MDERTLDLQIISKYRKELMGIAIVFIMLCHSNISFKVQLLSEPFSIPVSQFMQIGVDIFLILSGLGCAFSFYGDSRPMAFYRKRLLRILPTYVLITAVWILFQVAVENASASEMLFRFSLISFLTDGVLTAWFVAAILVFYMLFPLLWKLTPQHLGRFLGYIAGVYLVSGLIMLGSGNSVLKTVNEIMIIRLPAFWIGIVLGKRMKSGDTEMQSHHGAAWILLLLGVLAFLANVKWNRTCKWWLARGMFGPLAVILTIELSCLLNWLAARSWGKMLTKILAFLGTITFEVYLIQEKAIPYCEKLVEGILGKRLLATVLAKAGAVVLTVILACAVKLAIDELTAAVKAAAERQKHAS